MGFEKTLYAGSARGGSKMGCDYDMVVLERS